MGDEKSLGGAISFGLVSGFGFCPFGDAYWSGSGSDNFGCGPDRRFKITTGVGIGSGNFRTGVVVTFESGNKECGQSGGERQYDHSSTSFSTDSGPGGFFPASGGVKWFWYFHSRFGVGGLPIDRDTSRFGPIFGDCFGGDIM